MRWLLLPLVLALGAITSRAAAEDVGVARLMKRSYALGTVHGRGGALGDGVVYDAIRYSETNGALMNLTFGTVVRIAAPEAPAHIECNTGACTYVDLLAFVPMRSKVSGGLFGAGVYFPWQKALVQLGIAIGFYGDSTTRHARDALVLGAAVPITRAFYARMRMDLNLYSLFPAHALAGYHKNSPMSAGVSLDLGQAFTVTADVERYDMMRGGLGGFVGLALQL